MAARHQQYYDPARRRIVFFSENATPEFWDRQWSYADLAGKVEAGANWEYLSITRRYLPPDAGPVLEGGCGIGHAVYGLQKAGYEAIGLDFARKTLESVRAIFPSLDLREGDVRNIPLPDASVAGYWSLGVIEHFYEGYDPILREMARVIRPGGILFLTVPHMSWLRRTKARLGLYPRLPDQPALDRFYQFALDRGQLLADLRRAGFDILETRADDGLKGFKDEIRWGRRWLQELYDGKRRSRARKPLERLLSTFAGHILLVVARRAQSPAGTPAPH